MARPISEVSIADLINPVSTDKLVISTGESSTEIGMTAARILDYLGPRCQMTIESFDNKVITEKPIMIIEKQAPLLREDAEDIEALDYLGVLEVVEGKNKFYISQGPKYYNTRVTGTRIDPPLWKFWREPTFVPLEERK